MADIVDMRKRMTEANSDDAGEPHPDFGKVGKPTGVVGGFESPEEARDFLMSKKGDQSISSVAYDPGRRWVVLTPGVLADENAEGCVRVNISMERVLTVEHRVGGKWERLVQRTLSEDDCKGMHQFM